MTQSRLSWALFAGLSVSASVSSSHAAGFVTEIDWRAPRLTSAELIDVVKAQAAKPVAGLSLGETHLERETANEAHALLVNAYLAERPAQLKTCIEIRTGLLDSPAYPAVKAASREVEIEKKNDPMFTDFGNCYRKKRTHYLVYSGFYHQHPFAAAFPEVFTLTPVLTDPGNNIRAQMAKVDLLFVAQIELPYLALQETSRILKHAAKDPTSLASEVTATGAAFSALQNQLEPLVAGPIPELTKSAVILDRRAFPKQASAFPHDRAFLMITDLAHRKNRSPLFLLEEILKLDSSTRAAFVGLLQKEKHFISAPLMAPTTVVHERNFHVPDVEEAFTGETVALTFHGGKSGRTVLVDPEALKIRCFLTSAGRAREDTCASVLQAE